MALLFEGLVIGYNPYNKLAELDVRGLGRLQAEFLGKLSTPTIEAMVSNPSESKLIQPTTFLDTGSTVAVLKIGTGYKILGNLNTSQVITQAGETYTLGDITLEFNFQTDSSGGYVLSNIGFKVWIKSLTLEFVSPTPEQPTTLGILNSSNQVQASWATSTGFTDAGGFMFESTDKVGKVNLSVAGTYKITLICDRIR